MYKLLITFRSAKKKKNESRNVVQKGQGQDSNFWVFENIGNIQFINRIEALYPRETHNMKEAWTL